MIIELVDAGADGNVFMKFREWSLVKDFIDGKNSEITKFSNRAITYLLN